MNKEVEEMWEARFRGEVIKMAVLKEFPDYVIYECGLIYDYKWVFEDPYDLSKCIKLIKVSPRKKGYPSVNLRTKDSLRKKEYVHRIMAMAFVSNPDNKPQINHKNGDTNDYRVENLEWVTSKENVRHSIVTGLRKKGIVLNADDVVEIKKRLAQGESVSSINLSFPVNNRRIYDIANGRTWAHIALS